MDNENKVIRFADLTATEQREILRWFDPVPAPFNHNPVHVGYDRHGDPIWHDHPVIKDI